jgi:hypothetical protein
MTSPSPSQIRRRRRILATLAVLVLVSFFSWWYWPRGDARFVGKWTVLSPSGGPPAVMTLGANGMASTAVPGAVHSTFPWRVSGNKFYYGWSCSGFAHSAANQLASIWTALTGTLVPVGEQSLDLLDISYESISYRRPALAGPATTADEEIITMTRIPE